jgi:hypothetical protein
MQIRHHAADPILDLGMAVRRHGRLFGRGGLACLFPSRSPSAELGAVMDVTSVGFLGRFQDEEPCATIAQVISRINEGSAQ